MSEIPKTRRCVRAHEAEHFRSYIRNCDFMHGRIVGARVARPEDAAALAGLLSDPSIGPRIYTMPPVIDEPSMSDLIGDHLMQRARGEGILFLAFDTAGEATAYFDVELWPEWGAAKFGGAVRATRQGRGFGGACGLAAVEWCFDQLGVHRICETTARDNHRSIRLLSRLGFEQAGEVTAHRPDGSTRPSLYWELERLRWKEAQAQRKVG